MNKKREESTTGERCPKCGRELVEEKFVGFGSEVKKICRFCGNGESKKGGAWGN